LGKNVAMLSQYKKADSLYVQKPAYCMITFTLPMQRYGEIKEHAIVFISNSEAVAMVREDVFNDGQDNICSAGLPVARGIHFIIGIPNMRAIVSSGNGS
jgi:hypothetical protein